MPRRSALVTLALALCLCAARSGRAQSCNSHQLNPKVLETDCSNIGLPRVALTGDRSLLPDTTDLIFNGNQLASLNENSLQGLAKLRSASFARNHIRYVMRGTFEPTPLLELLNLTSNELSHLYADTFAHVLHLRQLDISRNLLAVLNESSFAHLPRLETLLLSHNRLHAVHPNAFRHLSALKTLALDDNLLVSLPGEVDLSPFPPALEGLRLGRNPWLCDCRLYWLRYRLQRQFTERAGRLVIADAQQMLCANETDASDVMLFMRKEVTRFGCRPTIFSPPAQSSANASFVQSSTQLVSARLGADVELRCDVYSLPRALENITWRRWSQVLWRGVELNWAEMDEQRDRRLSARIDGANNFSLLLRIEGLEPEDVGSYECETVNSYGHAIGHFELRVATHAVAASSWGELLSPRALVFVVAAALGLFALLVLASVLFCFKSASQRHASRLSRERRKLLSDGHNGDGAQPSGNSIAPAAHLANGPASVAASAACAGDASDSPISCPKQPEALANRSSIVLVSPANGSPQKPPRVPPLAPQAAVMPLDLMSDLVASAIDVQVDEHCPVHGRYAFYAPAGAVAVCGESAHAGAAFDLPVLYAARQPTYHSHNPTCPLHGTGSQLALVPIAPPHVCCVDPAAATYSTAVRNSYGTLPPRQQQLPLRRPFSDEHSREAVAAGAASLQDKSSPVFVPRDAFTMSASCSPNRLNVGTNRSTMLLQGVSLNLNVDDALDGKPLSAQTLSDSNVSDLLPLPEPLPPPILPAAAATAMRTNGPVFSSSTAAQTRESILSSAPRGTCAGPAPGDAERERQSSFDKEFPPPPPLPPLATTSGSSSGGGWPVAKSVHWTEDTVRLSNGLPAAPSNGSCA